MENEKTTPLNNSPIVRGVVLGKTVLKNYSFMNFLVIVPLFVFI